MHDAPPLALPFTEFTLANGLRVLVHEEHALPLACVNLWYHVGSKDERPGRTGLAHLFEHLMFEGSLNVPPGRFDQWLEQEGGTNNGSTSVDRTNYWETVPAHALELALFLEADRLGGLLPALTRDRFEAQRDVVKNERRQSYENRPYGLASELLAAALYPAAHGYSWPTIGWMPDLDDVSFEDALAFGRTHYTPANATLAIAGDVDTAEVERIVQRRFGPIDGSPRPATVRAADAPPRAATLVHEDTVQLPRLYLAWHSPAMFAPGDAALDAAAVILAHGRAARLQHTLVHERELAQAAVCYQSSALLSSTFRLVLTARPGVSLPQLHDEALALVRRLAREGPTEVELERARNGIETEHVDALQTVGGFGGRADRLNSYLFYAGDPDFAERDIARYRSLDAGQVAAALARCIEAPAVTLSVVPHGRPDLAVR